MDDFVAFKMDQETVRFTPDGKIVVVDAIKALGQVACPECVWQWLVEENPEVKSLCSQYRFDHDQPVDVIDGQGWTVLQMMLLDYVIEQHDGR